MAEIIQLANSSIDLKTFFKAGQPNRYITQINSDGIFIAPWSQFPSSGSEGNSIKINGDGLFVYNGGIQVAKYGIDALIGREANGYYNVLIDADGGIALRQNTTEYTKITTNTITVGPIENDKSRTEISGSGMKIISRKNNNDIIIANLGYGLSNTADGSTAYSPYYTFGTRINSLTRYNQYSSNKTYQAGDLCVYQNFLYVCTQTISTAEAWNSSHWSSLLDTKEGAYSATFGINNIAASDTSCAIGRLNIASGEWSFAVGGGGDPGTTFTNNIAAGRASFAGGSGTIAYSAAQFAIGTYNKIDKDNNYIFIVGNGGLNARSNAFTIDENGFIGATSINYGECETNLSVTEKVVTVTNSDFKLIDGAIVIIYFRSGTGVNNPTLNVNGTGAKSIVTESGVAESSAWRAGSIKIFVYHTRVGGSPDRWFMI